MVQAGRRVPGPPGAHPSRNHPRPYTSEASARLPQSPAGTAVRRLGQAVDPRSEASAGCPLSPVPYASPSSTSGSPMLSRRMNIRSCDGLREMGLVCVGEV